MVHGHRVNSLWKPIRDVLLPLFRPPQRRANMPRTEPGTRGLILSTLHHGTLHARRGSAVTFPVNTMSKAFNNPLLPSVAPLQRRESTSDTRLSCVTRSSKLRVATRKFGHNSERNNGLRSRGQQPTEADPARVTSAFPSTPAARKYAPNGAGH